MLFGYYIIEETELGAGEVLYLIAADNRKGLRISYTYNLQRQTTSNLLCTATPHCVQIPEHSKILTSLGTSVQYMSPWETFYIQTKPKKYTKCDLSLLQNIFPHKWRIEVLIQCEYNLSTQMLQ